MFDNLRDLSDDSKLFAEPAVEASTPQRRRSGRRFLGMTPGQRFLLSILLLATVMVMGAMCLLVTEKVIVF